MKIDGSCHCRSIRYEAEINPDYVILCHCTDCQTMSGAPYRINVPVLVEKFIIRGELQRYIKIHNDVLRNMRFADLFVRRPQSTVRLPTSRRRNATRAVVAKTSRVLYLSAALGA